jgi:hypothetical protein
MFIKGKIAFVKKNNKTIIDNLFPLKINLIFFKSKNIKIFIITNKKNGITLKKYFSKKAINGYKINNKMLK